MMPNHQVTDQAEATAAQHRTPPASRRSHPAQQKPENVHGQRPLVMDPKLRLEWLGPAFQPAGVVLPCRCPGPHGPPDRGAAAAKC